MLRSAVRSGLLQRRKLDGVFVYLSPDPDTSADQLAARRQLTRPQRPSPSDPLDPLLIIEVLLALIRHPRCSPTQLARHLRGHSPPIRRPLIAAVFQRFDLQSVVEKGGPTVC